MNLQIALDARSVGIYWTRLKGVYWSKAAGCGSSERSQLKRIYWAKVAEEGVYWTKVAEENLLDEVSWTWFSRCV